MKQKTIDRLRTLNLLEPMAETGGHPIISISKIFMWVSLFAYIALLIALANGLVDIKTTLGGLGGVAAASLNYAHRRGAKNIKKKTSKIITKV